MDREIEQRLDGWAGSYDWREGLAAGRVSTDPREVRSIVEEVAEMERNTTYEGYKISTLRSALQKVTDPLDWKGPIEAWVPAKKMRVTLIAIKYFTATEGKVTAIDSDGKVHIIAPGYRQGPAGDH